MLGLVLVLFGVGWLLEALGVDVPWDIVFPAVLIGIGIMLVSSARSGAGQVGLIVAGIVLTILLVLGTAIDIPLGGGVGDRTVRPSAERIEPEYERGIGKLTLDLTEVAFGAIDVPARRSGQGRDRAAGRDRPGGCARPGGRPVGHRQREDLRSGGSRVRRGALRPRPHGGARDQARGDRRDRGGAHRPWLTPRLNRSALVAGVFFIAAGVVFLLERLGVWDVSLRVLGPVLLITLGVAIVLGGRAHPPPS